MKFFDWAYNSGAEIATKMEYVALPTVVENAVRASWRAEIKDASGAPIWK